MKYATFSKSAVAVTAILFGLVACANSADVPTEEKSAPTEPAPVTSKVPPSTPTTPAAPEKKCVTSCKTDADCANSCPALAGGVQCCDTHTGTCWGSKTSACPKPAEPADSGAPAY